MKRVVLKYISDFPDDTPDEVCVASAIESCAQTEWGDDNITIEAIEGEPEY